MFSISADTHSNPLILMKGKYFHKSFVYFVSGIYLISVTKKGQNLDANYLKDMKSFTKKTRFNCKVEHFHKSVHITIASKNVYGKRLKRNHNSHQKQSTPRNSYSNTSISRAKRSIWNIAQLNFWYVCVTLTLDPMKINRESKEVVNQKLLKWLKSMRRRVSDFGYLLVPQLHNDGKGIHFHGFFKGYVRLKDTGNTDSHDRKIYSVCNWQYGDSYATRVLAPRTKNDGERSIEGWIHYITEGITKADDDVRDSDDEDITAGKKILKHYYYAGGDIVRSPVTEYRNADYNAFSGRVHYVEPIGTYFKYLKVDGRDKSFFGEKHHQKTESLDNAKDGLDDISEYSSLCYPENSTVQIHTIYIISELYLLYCKPLSDKLYQVKFLILQDFIVNINHYK